MLPTMDGREFHPACVVQPDPSQTTLLDDLELDLLHPLLYRPDFRATRISSGAQDQDVAPSRAQELIAE